MLFNKKTALIAPQSAMILHFYEVATCTWLFGALLLILSSCNYAKRRNSENSNNSKNSENAKMTIKILLTFKKFFCTPFLESTKDQCKSQFEVDLQVL